MAKLDSSFYLQTDVVSLAKQLLGKQLVTYINGQLTAAVITETEAYAGAGDRASHAFGGRYTNRTRTIYATGGTAYVYLCYGIHHLFNVVTNVEGVPHAILVRAGKPVAGLETILERRQQAAVSKKLLGGPGTFSQGLGITTRNNGISLLDDTIWIEDTGFVFPENEIHTGPRIGVAYALEDALLPYRFWVNP